MIDWKIGKCLHEAAGPTNGGDHRAFCLAESEENLFAVLREKSRAGLQRAGLASHVGFYCDNGTDRVAIAFHAAQAEGNRRRKVSHYVLQDAQLRAVAIFQEDFLATVMVEIREREGATVFEKIETNGAGDIGKRAVTDCWRRRRCARSRSRCRQSE